MKISLSDHFNYTRLIRFTLPTIAMMICTSIYGIVDGLFVSNVVGSTAYASVNLIIPVSMVLSTLGFMVGSGGGALVSKTLGEGKQQLANEYFTMLTVLLFVAGIVLAVLGVVFVRPISLVLGADEAMLHDCILYGTVSFMGTPFYMLQNSFQSFLVVAEKPRMGLYVSIFCGVTNMVLDFVLIYVLRWGVIGAAIGTALSEVVGTVVPLVYFLCKKDLPLRFGRLRLYPRAMGRACGNGASEMVNNISMSLVNMLYNLQLMRIVGSGGVVAYGVIMYAGFIFTGVYFGYATGSTPLFGYHYGAGNSDELHNLYRRSLRLLVFVSILMTVLAELSAGLVARLYVGYDADLMALTRNAIMLYSLAYLFKGINVFAAAFFTGLNNGGVSAFVSFMRTFVLLTAAVLILPVLLGLNGIWLAVVFAEALALIVSGVCFHRYRRQYHY